MAANQWRTQDFPGGGGGEGDCNPSGGTSNLFDKKIAPKWKKLDLEVWGRASLAPPGSAKGQLNWIHSKFIQLWPEAQLAFARPY